MVRILLLEDDVRTAHFIADNLRADGFEVTLREEGDGPDLIVYDTNMQGAFVAVEGVPVIALLAQAEPVPEWATAFVEKPFFYGQLYNLARQLLAPAEVAR